MNVRGMCTALESLLGEEIAGKKLLLRELERQERALVAAEHAEVESATHAIEAEITRELDRARRRDLILGRLAAHWRVSVKALTLSSVVERAGEAGLRIDELRIVLRALAADVLRRNRRIARLVAVHEELVEETMTAVLGTRHGATETGVLFDARL